MNRQQTEEITALYCRFSQDDGKKESDSNSIKNQKICLMDYAKSTVSQIRSSMWMTVIRVRILTVPILSG